MSDLGTSTGAFLGLGSPYSDVDHARFLVSAIPYEHSPGGRAGVVNGPARILDASRRVEFFDEESFKAPARLGIATVEPKLPDLPPEDLAQELQAYAGRVQRAGKRAFYLGGEGSITQGLVRAYLNQYRDLTLLQFDAHPNLRSEYAGQRFGRMTAMARLHGELPITQVGIRSMSEEEANLTDKGNVSTYFAPDVLTQPLRSETVPAICQGLSHHVYVSLDMSVFDPSLCPGTNLPEPGGLQWQTVLEILRGVARERDIVAMDVVETVPIPHHEVTEYVAARMVYKVMGFLAQFRQWPELSVS